MWYTRPIGGLLGATDWQDPFCVGCWLLAAGCGVEWRIICRISDHIFLDGGEGCV
jgi:hypothetical protein